MRRKFLAYLACPECRADLNLYEVLREDVNGIEMGTLQCSDCRSKYNISKYVPRFVPMENYASGFGYQWNIHSNTQHDSYTGLKISETRFFKETKWPKDLSGQYILEVGSGSGRFTGHAASTGAMVISMDYSSAVDANYSCNGSLPNVLMVQADIYHMPFRKEFFDKVFCLGVLQHTPIVEEAFKSLVLHLKLGGQLAIDVYSKQKGFQRLIATKYYVRPLSKWIPSKLLYKLCKGYIELFWPIAKLLRKLPRGRRINWFFLIPDYKNVFDLSDKMLKEWAILELFDMLSPAYDNPQYLETVENWFREIGMIDVEVHYGQNGIEGRGTKPV